MIPLETNVEDLVKPRRTTLLLLCFALFCGAFVVAQNTAPSTATQSAAASASPASKIGLFVYPQKDQTAEQQAKDESACYESAQKQSGVDPSAAPPPPQEVDKKQGGAVKGAAGGAAGGAAIGAIAGDTGTGAAIGATAGAVRGRRQQKKANKAAEQQSQEQAQGQHQRMLDTFRRAFSACIDSKGYSVK
jgi:hypothetical protein